MIGVGFDFGLRNNKQETLNYIVNNAPTPNPDATFDTIDNELQTYWTLGLSYKFWHKIRSIKKATETVAFLWGENVFYVFKTMV